MDEIKILKDTCYLRVRLVVLKCLGILLLFNYIREIIRWIANSNLNMEFTNLYFELCENLYFSWTVSIVLGLIQLLLLFNIFRKINYINYTIKECRFLRAWMIIPFIFVILDIIGFGLVIFASDVTIMGYINVTNYLYYILVLYAGLICCIFFRSKVTYVYTIIFLVFILGFYLLFPYINCISEIVDDFYNVLIYNKLINIVYGNFNLFNTFLVANAVLLIDEKLLKLICHKIKIVLSYIKRMVKNIDR